MARDITAYEVQARVEHWERHWVPKLQASMEAMISPMFDEWWTQVHRYFLDQELQQQRMTDDGCPL